MVVVGEKEEREREKGKRGKEVARSHRLKRH
jgi:hypothetical protein